MQFTPEELHILGLALNTHLKAHGLNAGNVYPLAQKIDQELKKQTDKPKQDKKEKE